ncbi:hypothetical protein HDR63_04220, partial [bacterium]|nr:hypothetical protein [bacterium]
PARGKLYQDDTGAMHHAVYLTSRPRVALGHLMGRLGMRGPVQIDDTYVFDRVDMPAFGYLYTTEIPDDLEHYPLFATSRRPVQILEKYALTPTNLAKILPDTVRVMKPNRWRRLSVDQLADRVHRVVKRIADPDAQNKKIQKLLDKYTYTI